MSYTIKGLEWRRDYDAPAEMLWADTPYGRYCIANRGNSAEWYFYNGSKDFGIINTVANEGVAKQRCQNHYESNLASFLLVPKDPTKPLYTQRDRKSVV